MYTQNVCPYDIKLHENTLKVLHRIAFLKNLTVETKACKHLELDIAQNNDKNILYKKSVSPC